ncbi:hypothetical protein OURE66S_02344 [Oligella ureolytica]
MTTTYKPLSRDQMAARVAQDIHDGAYVNLGIGMPEPKVANYLPEAIIEKCSPSSEIMSSNIYQLATAAGPPRAAIEGRRRCTGTHLK